MPLPKPKNDYALVVRLLIENRHTGMSMAIACRDSFHKFQNRLRDLEKSPNQKGNPRAAQLKIRRLMITGKNRFGHSMTYMNYKSLAPFPYLVNLLKKLNREGLSKQK